ncbi:MAG: ATP-binding cassette domain-containing protein, partial [Proteobacteria bacterium]|nr:ATP-binding cassette domain-containing protein [Pseudomonadota bacterium]
MKDTANPPAIVRLQNVSKRFVKSLDLAAKIAQKLGVNIREEVVHAVDNVSLSIAQGEVVGLAGESGCGKSTLGRMVAGILPLSEGTIFYKGKDVAQLPSE